MKLRLFVCVLCSWVVAVRAGVLWWGDSPQADEPQTDEDDGTEMLRLVETLTNSLQGMTGQDDAWLTRYQELAEAMEGNNEMTQELLAISRTAMPIIWNIYAGSMMLTTLSQIKNGGVATPDYPATKGALVVPPPNRFLMVYPSELTVDSVFHVQACMRTTAEANVGFVLFYAPEEGEELDFFNDDILVAVHIRWHFDYGNSREIAFNDRYNGVWSRPEVAVGGDRWPDFQVGEKFTIGVLKFGPCFQAYIVLGRDMHLNAPFKVDMFKFCPKDPKTGDPRKLWLALNEDRYGANKIIPHYLMWFPVD